MTATSSRRKMSTAELEQFMRDLRLTYNRLRGLADQLHADLDITASLRAVMESIAIQGPSTVPAIAEQRSVSRQGIQKLVNVLLKRGLLARKPNPGHRRSDLIGLTSHGRAVYRKIRRREERHLRALAAALGSEEIRAAGEVLAELRNGLSRLTARRGEQS